MARCDGFAFQRTPTTTQSAVLNGFTFVTASRAPGRYGTPSRFAITPSRPAASNVSSQPRALSAIARARRQPELLGDLLEELAPLLERLLVHRLALPEQHVEGDELGRDLGGEPVDAALGRVEPHLHRVEVEDAVARDHDLAVERGVGRQQLAERPQLGEVAQQRPLLARPERQLAAVVLQHAAEAVPLRLVLPAVAGRQLGDELGLHRREGDVWAGHLHRKAMRRGRPRRARLHAGAPKRSRAIGFGGRPAASGTCATTASRSSRAAGASAAALRVRPLLGRRGATRRLEAQLKHFDEAPRAGLEPTRPTSTGQDCLHDRRAAHRRRDGRRRRSLVREAGGMVGALMKSLLDLTRSEKAARGARDVYATEHLRSLVPAARAGAIWAGDEALPRSRARTARTRSGWPPGSTTTGIASPRSRWPSASRTPDPRAQVAPIATMARCAVSRSPGSGPSRRSATTRPRRGRPPWPDESGIDFIRSFDATGFPVRVAAEVKDFEPPDIVSAKDARRLERNVLLALAAGREALDDAGLNGFDPARVGIVLGSAIGGFLGMMEQHEVLAGARARPRVAVLPAERAGRLGERAAGDLARYPRAELRGRVRLRDRFAHGRRGRRADPPRRRRRRARRRHGGGDAPADPGRLLRHARARRGGGAPAARLAAVRRDARRVRDRRGRMRARCSRISRRRRRAARRSTPRCSATAPRTTRTTWPRPTRSRSGVAEMMRAALAPGRRRAGARRLHQRARHVHAARRPGRDAGDQGRLRRPRLQAGRLLDQVRHRPLLRGGRRDRGDDVRARDPSTASSRRR